MSLTAAIKTGVSGLVANQQALSIISSNITNANVDGYTKKNANSETLTLGGQVVGVKISSITRNADEFFLKNLRGELSNLSKLQTSSSFYKEVESIFGNTGDGNSLTANITDFESKLQALITAPADSVQHSQIIATAEDLTAKIRDSISSIQNLRLRVDQEIEGSVKNVNTALTEIAKLNGDIGQASVNGRPIGDLMDSRDRFLKQIYNEMDVSVFPRNNDTIAIYTKSGQSLLENNPNIISYQSIGSIKPETRFEDNNFNAIEVSGSTITTDISKEIKSGKISGLINLRDNVLTELTDQLENLAGQLIDKMNEVHNQGVAYPPPTSLTSTKKISASDQFYATGTLRVAIMDNNGAYVNYKDIDLANVTTPGAPATTFTYQDFVNYLNNATTVGSVNSNQMSTYLDLSSPFNSDGTFTLKAKSGYSLAIGTPNSVSPPVEKISGKDQSLQSYFGFNDFFVTGLNNVPPQRLVSDNSIDPNNTITSASGIMTFTLADSKGNHISHLDYNLSTFSGTKTSDLITDINAKLSLASIGLTVSLDSNNKLVVSSNDQTNSVRLNTGSTPATINGSNGIDFLGVKDQRYRSTSIDVRQTIKDQPQKLARGKLNMPTITSAITTPIVGIGQGDARNLSSLNEMFLAKQAFAGTSKIGQRTLTISEYASLILDYTARDIASSQEKFDNQNSLVTSLEATRSSVSDVNIDEEMAQMLQLQNAYQVTAQIVKITNQMLDTLEQLMG